MEEPAEPKQLYSEATPVQFEANLVDDQTTGTGAKKKKKKKKKAGARPEDEEQLLTTNQYEDTYQDTQQE